MANSREQVRESLRQAGFTANSDNSGLFDDEMVSPDGKIRVHVDPDGLLKDNSSGNIFKKGWNTNKEVRDKHEPITVREFLSRL